MMRLGLKSLTVGLCGAATLGSAHAQESKADLRSYELLAQVIERPIPVTENFTCGLAFLEACIAEYVTNLDARCRALGFDELAGATPARELERYITATQLEVTFSCRKRAL